MWPLTETRLLGFPAVSQPCALGHCMGSLGSPSKALPTRRLNTKDICRLSFWRPEAWGARGFLLRENQFGGCGQHAWACGCVPHPLFRLQGKFSVPFPLLMGTQLPWWHRRPHPPGGPPPH